jgi:hypothetical protein
MAKMPVLKKGSRTFIAGGTGSGKTTLAVEFVRRSPQHAIILNPKHTSGYNRLPGVSILDDVKIDKIEKSVMKNKVTLLNLPVEYFDPEPQDAVLKHLHQKYENVMIVADELGTLHKGVHAFSGLKSVLTLGRELNQTFIGMTQRPSGISRHVISESDYLIMMKLNLLRDRKILNEEIGNPAVLEKLDERFWFFFTQSGDRLQLFQPIPLTKSLTG